MANADIVECIGLFKAELLCLANLDRRVLKAPFFTLLGHNCFAQAVSTGSNKLTLVLKRQAGKAKQQRMVVQT